MSINLENEFADINKRLARMQEFLEEIHRIVMSLHEQWNRPSSMDIPAEALKEKEIRAAPEDFRVKDPKLYR